MRRWVESLKGRFTLHRLPSCSPQLNPDEWVWKNVKIRVWGENKITGPRQFKNNVIRALLSLQNRTKILHGFFRDKHFACMPAAVRNHEPIATFTSKQMPSVVSHADNYPGGGFSMTHCGVILVAQFYYARRRKRHSG